MWQHPLVRLALLVVGAWFVVTLLLKVSWWLVLLVVVLAGVMAVIQWMLRYDRVRLARLYKQPSCKPVIDLVCRLTREQPPMETVPAAAPDRPAQPEEMLSLKQRADFEQAAQKLMKAVRGHDAIIQRVLSHLEKNIALRARRQGQGGAPPLGIYLLVGGEGIGKRSLAVRLGRLLYNKGGILDLDLKEYPEAAALFGSSSSEGALVGPIKTKPYHTVILENIDQASPKVLEWLAPLLATGSCRDESTGTTVSFQHCLFVLTASKCLDQLEAVKKAGVTHDAWHSQAQDILSSEAGLPVALLGLVHEIFYCERPSPVTKAEVVALLMQRECKNHNIALEHVLPEILAREAAAVSETHGFALMLARISKLLRTPLAQAAQRNQTSIRVGSRDLTLYGDSFNHQASTQEQEIVPS
jgi:hypothetical protein